MDSFLTDASGNVAEVNYIDTNGSPYASGNTLFLYTMCNDTDVLAQYAPEGAAIEKANVVISNPYTATPQNPVFTLKDLEKGRVGNGESVRGNPTILTEIPINGYTLYAEEPVEQLSGTDLEGRTMFMTPTSTKVLLPTKSASVPRRRSEGHNAIIDGKKRIVNEGEIRIR